MHTKFYSSENRKKLTTLRRINLEQYEITDIKVNQFGPEINFIDTQQKITIKVPEIWSNSDEFLKEGNI